MSGLLTCLVPLLVLVSLFLPSRVAFAEPPNMNQVRDRHFHVVAADGNEVDLGVLLPEGRPTIVEFFATWCAPCRKLMPTYVALARERAADSLVVVGLSVERPEDLGKVRDYMRDHGASYAYACAADEVYRFLNPGREMITVPRAFFFDRNGRCTAQINGVALFGASHRIRKAAKAICAAR